MKPASDGMTERDEDGAGNGRTGERTAALPEEALTPAARVAIERLLEEIQRLRDALTVSQRRIERLESMADEDPLTPAINRRAFLRELERAAAMSERYGVPNSVLFLDIDGFKAVNDRFGHAAGDEVLTEVARTLVENVRASDVVGRLGGDEFGVILAQADERQAREKANALAALIVALRIERDGERIPFSASAGSFTMGAGTSATDALAAADRAMYANKARRDRAEDSAQSPTSEKSTPR